MVQGSEEKPVRAGLQAGAVGDGSALAAQAGDFPDAAWSAGNRLKQLGMLVDALDDAIIGSDQDGCIVSWNQAAEAMFGYSAEEMRGKTTLLLTPEGLRDEALAIKKRVSEGERVTKHETFRVRKSGEIIEVSISVFPLRNGEGRLVGRWSIVRDVTDCKRTERRLRNLSWRLLRLQDDERRRIARDLHDSTAQILAGLTMNLTALNQAHGACPEPRHAQLLRDSLSLAEQALRELRTQAYLLHPPLLDERGLPAALRWLVDGFTQRSGIAVDLQLDPALERLPEHVETAFFRIVQECLTNVHRHSKSQTAAISLRREGGWIHLRVSDEGCGLPPECDERLGVGISGMKERLLQLGGTLSIDSSPAGTVVAARLLERP